MAAARPVRNTSMIVADRIPLQAEEFIRRCATDCRLGRYAHNGDYKAYLERETARVDSQLLDYLRRHDAKPGEPTYWAEADHIIPRSVWPLIMPRELRGEENREAHFMHTRSNLWWRGPHENHALDQRFINVIKQEAIVYARRPPNIRHEWEASRIEMFLRTKHDEALVFPGDLIEPYRFKALEAYNVRSNWMFGDTYLSGGRIEPMRDALNPSGYRPYMRKQRHP
jgi:hypothetical protein